MGAKHIAFLAASLLSGLAASVTYTTSAKTTVPVESSTVLITLDKQEKVVTLADMAIGDSTSGTLKIENTGTSPAELVLRGATTAGSSAALADKLMLSVFKDRDNDPSARVFPDTGSSAPLSAFNQSGADLGHFDRPCQANPGRACDASGKPSQWATGHQSTLYFHVTLTGFAGGVGDNALALLQANETFTITATKATGNGNGRRRP